MVIRKAIPDDSEIAVKLIWSAIEDQANIFSGTDNPEEIRKILEYFFAEKANRISYEFCDVVEIENKVVGSIVNYPGSIMKILDKPLIERLEKLYPKDSKEYKEKVYPLVVAKEANDDEYYIDSLAVLDGYRGHGIGRKLIKLVEEKALQHNFGKCSILAELNNTRAFDLYNRIGYEKDGIIEVGGIEYYHMVKNLK